MLKMQRRNQLDGSELTSSDLRMYNGLRYRLPLTLIQAFTSSPSLLPLSRIKAELASSNVAPHINGFVACVEQPHHCEISKITLCQASTLFMADSFTLRPSPIQLDRLLLIPYDVIYCN